MVCPVPVSIDNKKPRTCKNKSALKATSARRVEYVQREAPFSCVGLLFGEQLLKAGPNFLMR